MLYEVNLPSLSPTMEEGKIVKWIKKENDPILSGEVLFEVETDKATMEYESPEDGYIAKIISKEGETANVNQLVAIISDDLNFTPEEINNFLEKNNEENDDIDNIKQSSEDNSSEEDKDLSFDKILITPLAKKIAQKKNIDISKIKSNSRRIHSQDLDVSDLQDNDVVRLFISPLAKKISTEKSIDYSEINGTGPNNRIVLRDVIDTNQVSNNPKINKLRQAIAKATTQSKNNIPHFYLNTKVNMSNLLKFRKDQKLKGNKYSLNAILMQSISNAFKSFPDSNCTYKDSGEFIINKDHNIGIAVDSKFGLKMPVVKKVNNFDLNEINSNLNEMINLTRENKLSPSDLSDGVISISNLGSFNIRSFDAIILPGQTYILAVGQIFEDVFVDKGKIEIGSFINLTLSCDHRAVDGVLASQFFSNVVQNLENISDDN